MEANRAIEGSSKKRIGMKEVGVIYIYFFITIYVIASIYTQSQISHPFNSFLTPLEFVTGAGVKFLLVATVLSLINTIIVCTKTYTRALIIVGVQLIISLFVIAILVSFFVYTFFFLGDLGTNIETSLVVFALSSIGALVVRVIINIRSTVLKYVLLAIQFIFMALIVLTDLIIVPANVEKCANISFEEMQIACYVRHEVKGIILRDICLSIPDVGSLREGDRENCMEDLFNYGLVEADGVVCRNVGESLKESCYETWAVRAGDISICDNILDKNSTRICKSNVNSVI